MQILDCTLRDGGYYTRWDFDAALVANYIKAFNQLPVAYLEIGYRSVPIDGYLGEYYYLPLHVIESIKKESNKPLAIILNEKDINLNDLDALLDPCVGLIDLVRIAVSPNSFKKGLELGKNIKSKGFKVGLNVMYMSTWMQQNDFLALLPHVNDVADYFYMVDSYGGVYPEDVKQIFELVSKVVKVPIGFHGHNNLELALINTLTAIECGATIVDATVTGMGRGAGNMKTELLLTSLNAKGKLDFDFNVLAELVDNFTQLQKQYDWGTNLPYMFSGAHSLPQKEVMDWVQKRYYSFNSIIRGLDSRASKGRQFDILSKDILPKVVVFKKALIVGGGQSVIQNEKAIRLFLDKNPDVLVIHASSKNAMTFQSIANTQVFCLVGNEGLRLEDVFSGAIPGDSICVLPPSPRKMGTYVPQLLANDTYELAHISFSEKYQDSHTAIALQTAISFDIKDVFAVGYDGYDLVEVKSKDHDLFIENELLFESVKPTGLKLTSLTKTKYTNLNIDSIFSKI